jgi:D-alanyl-D-alanine carboxypeptidase/D-alanyl-D-alanine-endopeptidase (penicillin-binding protein 4)
VKIGEVKSPPLRELVRAFFKPSQNLETDLVFDHAGEKSRDTNSPAWETSEELAVAALEKFLARNDVPADVNFDEGSGLSRNNLTSANATVALLSVMAMNRWAKDYYDALPIAGVDGTLRRRMKNTPAFQNVRAKTGTLRWVNALSGYVTTAAGEKLVFSLMLNRYDSPPNRRRTDELDYIAVLLAGFRGRSDE